MFRSIKAVLVLLAVLATMGGLAVPADAATWTVTIGSTATGSGTFTATSNGSVSVKDVTTGIVFSCTSSAVSGAITHLGSGLNNPLLTESSRLWTSCTGPLGLAFAFTHNGIWSWNFTASSGSTVSGYISGVNTHVTASGCAFDVTGAMDITFANNTQVASYAAIAGSGHVLTISGVSGCFGMFGNGHIMSVTQTQRVVAKTSSGTAGALTMTTP